MKRKAILPVLAFALAIIGAFGSAIGQDKMVQTYHKFDPEATPGQQCQTCEPEDENPSIVCRVQESRTMCECDDGAQLRLGPDQACQPLWRIN